MYLNRTKAQQRVNCTKTNKIIFSVFCPNFTVIFCVKTFQYRCINANFRINNCCVGQMLSLFLLIIIFSIWNCNVERKWKNQGSATKLPEVLCLKKVWRRWNWNKNIWKATEKFDEMKVFVYTSSFLYTFR